MLFQFYISRNLLETLKKNKTAVLFFECFQTWFKPKSNLLAYSCAYEIRLLSPPNELQFYLATITVRR